VESVTVRKLKRPVGSGAWGAYVLGADEYGTWLHTPAGSRYRGNDGEQTLVCEVAQDSHGVGRPIVALIPTSGWWIATWYPASSARSVTVDVCTPPVITDRVWTYTDLELDPWRDVDGLVEVDDWAEFRDSCTSGQIRPDEAAAATLAVRQVEEALRQSDEPFGHVGPTRLERALALRLPPVTDIGLDRCRVRPRS
jgi:hypothetical protein